ncbi:RNA-binding S4 domain-containing protein [Pontibaca methylaminivorans]|uniref:RNA-binding S4 domain-containing protein n=1 Tax=Pontibaca methylaminivorans TaxID=515897 RepID=UPI002FD91754
MADPAAGKLRIDKWLWHARFFRTRSLAGKAVREGLVRLNSERITKPAEQVGEGDVLTFPRGRQVVVVRVVAPGLRRGPAEEARALFELLSPLPVPEPGSAS